MRKNIKTFFLTLTFLLLTGLLLAFPKESLAFSLTGLQLWFNRMVPTLLPFMILSGIMIRLNLTEHVVKAVSPFLMTFFKISLNGIYAIVIGFLCGFPMGAKVIADLYEGHKISKKEASFLLAFCNNIGPVYFISFVLPTLDLSLVFPYVFGMYGLPLCYGVFLRHTVYQNAISIPSSPSPRKLKSILSAAEGAAPVSLLDTLDDSILSGLYSIAKLGGYMVLFNLLNLLPRAFFLALASLSTLAFLPVPAILPATAYSGVEAGAVINCLLEITSGISRIGSHAPLIVLLLLPFGGFSCIAQTYSMIKNTDLSLKNYLCHKLVLTGITLLYYFLWQLLFPSSFLL